MSTRSYYKKLILLRFRRIRSAFTRGCKEAEVLAGNTEDNENQAAFTTFASKTLAPIQELKY